MTEEITKDLLLQTLQTQQKMSEDIAEIKGTIKEAAQIVTHLNRDVTEIKDRLRRVENHPLECPAARRHDAWSMTSRDVLWLLGLVAAIAGVIAIKWT